MPYHLHLPVGEDTIAKPLVPGQKYAPARYAPTLDGSRRAIRIRWHPNQHPRVRR